MIEASAVLHQVSRERIAAGEIVATLEDYATVRALVEDIVGEGSKVKVHPSVRETVEKARELLDEDKEISNSIMASKLGTTSQNAGRRLGTAESKGHLKLSDSSHSRRKVYMMGEKMPDDAEMLPTVGAIQQRIDVERLNGRISESGREHESEGDVSATATVQRTVQQRVSNRSTCPDEESILHKTAVAGHAEKLSEAPAETNRSTVQRDAGGHVEPFNNGTSNGSLNGWDEIVQLWEEETGLDSNHTTAEIIEFSNDSYEYCPYTWLNRLSKDRGIDRDIASVVRAMRIAGIEPKDDHQLFCDDCGNSYDEKDADFDSYEDLCPECRSFEYYFEEEDRTPLGRLRDGDEVDHDAFIEVMRQEEMYDGVEPESYA